MRPSPRKATGTPPARAPLTSISRSALDVEDGAAPTLRADEPLAAAGITEPERAAADGPRRHQAAIARAGRRFAGRVRLAQLALLLRRELRPLHTVHNRSFSSSG